MRRLGTFLYHAVKEGIVFVPLSEAARYFAPARVDVAATRDCSTLMANGSAAQPFVSRKEQGSYM
jgi:hypothetical protein